MTAPAAVADLAHRYFWGWQERDWDQLRGVLAPDVEFEDPRLGQVTGIEAHIALYAQGTRFPDFTSVALRRVAHGEDAAFLSYDVYLGHWRKLTVIDQLSARNGRIVHVLSVTSEWPPRSPSAGA